MPILILFFIFAPLNLLLTFKNFRFMQYFICYYRSTVGTDNPVVFVTDSQDAKDRFLSDAWYSDIDDATYKTIDLG